MQSHPKKNNKTPPPPADGGRRRRGLLAATVEALVLSGKPIAKLYDAVCSQYRLMVSPKLYPYLAFTEAAKREMAERAGGIRIFTSRDDVKARVTAISSIPRPATCKLDAASLGRTTLAQVPPDIAVCDRTYAGNWAILVRRGEGHSSRNRYLTVCGFFECGAGKKAHGLGRERFVKHVNLCEYGRTLDSSAEFVYLFSGTFVAGAGRGHVPRVLVNARSGTWAMAKRLLLGNTMSIDEAALDLAVVELARPKVARIVRRVVGTHA